MQIKLEQFFEMLNGAEKVLSLERNYINDLNVFPVPDGDTGSNMHTTINGALIAIKQYQFNNFSELGQKFARAVLMNARGNSGVILSQIIRGFVSNFTEDIIELDAKILQDSFRCAKQCAYKSVNNPVEGTILTVIRVIADTIAEKEYDNVIDLMNDVVTIGQQALDSTPDLLVELKEVGVVDSGGYGLLAFLKGMNAVLNNNLSKLLESLRTENNTANFEFFSDKKDLGFGYCSEVIINLNLQVSNESTSKIPFEIEQFKEELNQIGDSMVCTQLDNLIKVHIHTLNPHKLLEISQKYGEFERIKIENMNLQYDEQVNKNIATNMNNKPTSKLKKGLSVIMTVPTYKIGSFIKEDFLVDEVIITEELGAPSLTNFVDSIYKACTDNVIIITDDSNIVLTANEVKNSINEAKIEVIGATNMFEALSCAAVIDKNESITANYKEMKKTLKSTVSAVISTSVRDVNYSHINVKKNNKIGIINKKIVVSSYNEFQVLKTTLDKLIGNKTDFDICYIIYGKNADSSALKQFEQYASEQYGLYCEIRLGEQKVYDYYIGLQ